LECETFVKNIHGKNQKGVCHVIGDKHGDECKQNFKQHGDLGGKKRPRCPKPLFIGAKAFMKATIKEMHFLFMFFPHQMLNHVHMKFLPNTKNSKMCLKRGMWTFCPNINHMIAPLILWKKCNLHSDPSIICHKTNLECFTSTLMRTLKMGSFDIQSF
jgi:hypothetical protein